MDCRGIASRCSHHALSHAVSLIPADVQKELDKLAHRIRELELSHTRSRSEVRAEINDIISGLQAHVDKAVQSALKPYLEKLSQLDRIAADAIAIKAMAEETREYRIRRDEQEKLERERRAYEVHSSAVAKTNAEIRKLEVDISTSPTEFQRRYTLGVVGVVAAVLSALAGLIGAAIGSHR